VMGRCPWEREKKEGRKEHHHPFKLSNGMLNSINSSMYLVNTRDGLSQQRDRARGASKWGALISQVQPCHKPAGRSSCNSTIGLESWVGGDLGINRDDQKGASKERTVIEWSTCGIQCLLTSHQHRICI
jgi:hypothetical protein